MMQRKYLITIFFIIVSQYSLHAQNDDKTVTLGEVVVEGGKTVSKADGMVLYPTEAQKKSSNNGYSILQKLSLPNIRIDNISHAVSAIDNKGAVQLRINDIIVGEQEMISLDPKLISRIDFIDNPGVRYGEGTAYVVNIITRKAGKGYTTGTDATAAMTSQQGNATVYGKWNTGKSELSLSADIGGYRLKNLQNSEMADYILNDGSIHSIERKNVETLMSYLQHGLNLTYNLADSASYVFQASLSGSIGRTPGNHTVKDITDGAEHYSATGRESNRSMSPVIDLYFFRQITPRQSVTANVVSTYIKTNATSSNDEGGPYRYDVDGKTMSVMSEAIYENRLKPFTLSAGLNHSYKYTRNDYTGDATALTAMRQNKIYAFGEIKGMMKCLRYSLGAGLSSIHYNQNEHSYNYLTLRPRATITCDAAKGLQLSYTFNLSDRLSRIAMISDAVIRTNSMEWTVGNPDLKPGRDVEQTVRLSYNTSRWQTFAEVYYKQCNKPSMAHYERTADDKFIYTQINQKEIDLLHTMAYASCWLLPEKLQVAVYGGLQRCFNYGFDYTHHYTSWFYTASATAYLGKFTLYAYIDSGNRFLEGETKGKSGGYNALQASYNHKDLQVSLSWEYPLCNSYQSFSSELLSRHLHKKNTGHSPWTGNNISLNLSWRINRGKKHNAADKAINLKDTDNGIIGR